MFLSQFVYFKSDCPPISSHLWFRILLISLDFFVNFWKIIIALTDNIFISFLKQAI